MLQYKKKMSNLEVTRRMAFLTTLIKSRVLQNFHNTCSSAEVKETWIYTSTPPYVFMA
jgi:uncharacterized protein YjaG (DUF416 family)